MDSPSIHPRDLAQRLLAIEAERNGDADPHAHEAVRVCEKLQVSVTRFAGADGFSSLLRRALALAQAEVPAMQTVELKPDCALQGIGALAADTTHGGADAPVAIITHLLGLLVTFIGESLTLRLVREAWPGALLHGWDQNT